MVVGLRQSFDEFPKVLDETFPESSIQSGNEFTYLGMSLKRGPEEHTSRIHQIPYITTLLETFGMTDCNPVSSPCAADLFDPKEDVSEP